MRKLVSVVASAVVLLSLSACTSEPRTFAGCDPAGNAALVKADGGFGADPKADFPTPLVAKKPELAVVDPGDGHPVKPDGGVDIVVSVYNGKTGDSLTGQQGPLTIRAFVDGAFPFTKALSCASEGARIVTTGTSTQLLGEANIGNLDPDMTLVVVTDVQDTFLGRANGVDQLPQSGYPSVVLAPNGQPGFTFPDGDAPADLQFAALKQGNGATVKQGDSIIVNLTGIVWGGSATFSSTWTNNSPASLVASELDASGAGVVPGLAKALIGQRVGSQVIAVVPPEDGYPSGQAPTGIAEGDTLVFVVDILGIG